MAEGKKSFVLYCDQKEMFEHLPPEMCKKLILHLFRYVNDENPQTDDVMLNALFAPIKHQLKRDLQKWEKRAENSRENGKKGGRPKTQQNPTKPSGLINNPDEPRKPVNVNVNGNVSVNDTVNVKAFKDNIHECYDRLINFFSEDTKPKTDKAINVWKDEIRKLIEIDGYTDNDIIHVVKLAREDDFWSKNFLSLTKLRSKDKHGIKYIVVLKNNFINKNGNGQDIRKRKLAEALHKKFGAKSTI